MVVYDQIQDSIRYIRQKTGRTPDIGIITGTGLGGWRPQLQDAVSISYQEIPHFPQATAPSHQGELHLGTLSDRSVCILDGRLHCYEGHTMQDVAFGTRLLKFLGVHSLILTNVSGSVNPAMKVGDLCAITDHINWMFDNPLMGPNDDRLGTRFPDMSAAYDPVYLRLAQACAGDRELTLHQGVYLAMTGPSLETPAEYAYVHKFGADLVGMSTVPEVIAARHLGLRVMALSVVSNLCYPPEEVQPTAIEDVMEVAKARRPVLQGLIMQIIANM